MKAISKKISTMVRGVCIIWEMVTVIKEHGKMGKNMEMELKHIKAVLNM